MLPKGQTIKYSKLFRRHKPKRITKAVRRCQLVCSACTNGQLAERRCKIRGRNHAPSPNFRRALHNYSNTKRQGNMSRRELPKCNLSVLCERTSKIVLRKANLYGAPYWEDQFQYGCNQKPYSPSCFTTLDTIHPTMGRELINDEECDAEVEAIMCSKKYDRVRPYDRIQTPYWNDHIPYCSQKPYSPSCFTSYDTINPEMGTALIKDIECDTEVAAITIMSNSPPFNPATPGPLPFQDHNLEDRHSDCKHAGHSEQFAYQRVIKNRHNDVSFRTSTNSSQCDYSNG